MCNRLEVEMLSQQSPVGRRWENFRRTSNASGKLVNAQRFSLNKCYIRSLKFEILEIEVTFYWVMISRISIPKNTGFKKSTKIPQSPE